MEIGAGSTPLTVRDQILCLLNSASDSVMPEETLLSLQSSEELLLFRKDVDEDERSALLHEFLPSLIGFASHKNPKVKVFVISFTEHVAKFYFEQLPHVVSPLLYMVGDDSEIVKKKLLQVGVLVYKRCLAFLAVDAGTEGGISFDLLKTWQTLCQLRTKLVQFLGANTELMRSLAIKFVESIALSHSVVTEDLSTVKTSAKSARLEPCGPDGFSLVDVPKNHSFLNIPELRQTGEKMVRYLLQEMEFFFKNPDAKFSMKNILVALNSLTSLGSHRSAFVPLILPGILAAYKLFSKTRVHKTEKEVKTLQNWFKSTLLKLLKLTSSFNWHTELLSILHDLGASDQAEKAREISAVAAVRSINHRKSSAIYRKLKPDLEEESNHWKKPRGDFTVHSGVWPPTTNRVDLPIHQLSKLGRANLVDIVTNCMRNIPPRPQKVIYPNRDGYKSTDALKTLMQSLCSIQALSDTFSEREAIAIVDHCKIQDKIEHDAIAPSTEKKNQRILQELRYISFQGEEFKCFATKTMGLLRKKCPASPEGEYKWFPNLRGTVTFSGCNFDANKTTEIFAFVEVLKDNIAEGNSIVELLSCLYVFCLASGRERFYKIILEGLLESCPAHNLKKDRLLDLGHLYMSFPVIPPECLKILEIQLHHETCTSNIPTASTISSLLALRELIRHRPSVRKQSLHIVLDLASKRPQRVAKLCAEVLFDYPVFSVCSARNTILIYMKTAMEEASQLHCNAHDCKTAVELWDDRIGKFMYPYLKACSNYMIYFPGMLNIYARASNYGRKLLLRKLDVLTLAINLNVIPEMEKKSFYENLFDSPPECAAPVALLLAKLFNSGPSRASVNAILNLMSPTNPVTLWALIPVVPGMEKEEVFPLLTFLIKTSLPVACVAMKKLLYPTSREFYPVTALELLIWLHRVKYETKSERYALILLIKLCMSESLEKWNALDCAAIQSAISQLTSDTDTPPLLMRLVIIFLQDHPTCVDFVLSTIRALIEPVTIQNLIVSKGIRRCLKMVDTRESQQLLEQLEQLGQ